MVGNNTCMEMETSQGVDDELPLDMRVGFDNISVQKDWDH